ncbi:MAG TPA: TetR/AcrR family transcriptional regulator [Terracidiphilus sp.]|jgi:AcrR family transcriptional regulator
MKKQNKSELQPGREIEHGLRQSKAVQAPRRREAGRGSGQSKSVHSVHRLWRGEPDQKPGRREADRGSGHRKSVLKPGRRDAGRGSRHRKSVQMPGRSETERGLGGSESVQAPGRREAMQTPGREIERGFRHSKSVQAPLRREADRGLAPGTSSWGPRLQSTRGAGQRRPSRRPGRPTTHSGLYAREKLIEAATELFAKQGVAATTFAVIAERARLTPAMLHYYFKDRDQLLDAVVEERLAPLIVGVWAPVAEGAGPVELARGIVERMLAGIEKMPWVPSTWMREVLNEGGLLRERVLRHLPFQKIAVFSEVMARAQAVDVVNAEIDPTLIVFSVIGLVMMHMATIHLWGKIFGRKTPGREELSRHITGLLTHGLQPAASGKTGARMKRETGSRRK